MADAQARRILRLRLNVADVAASGRFYTDALGFSPAPGVDGDGLRLRLGEQEIELAAATGAPYPRPRAANDPWFQHFAIAVGDADQAYRRLQAYGAPAISTGGPQRLPPSTGSVTAYKFRDPDGHPLELSYAPDSVWARRRSAVPFLGIDHTALAVRDLDASIAFYCERLGFALGQRFLNTGPEQDRLDGLDGVELDIVVLQTAAPGPHVELLHYRSPESRATARAPAAGDIAATVLVVETSSLAASAASIGCAAIEATQGGEALHVLDPDGHRLTLVEPD